MRKLLLHCTTRQSKIVRRKDCRTITDMDDLRQLSSMQAVPGSRQDTVAQAIAVLSTSCAKKLYSVPHRSFKSLRLGVDSGRVLTSMPAILSMFTLLQVYPRRGPTLLSTCRKTYIKHMFDRGCCVPAISSLTEHLESQKDSMKLSLTLAAALCSVSAAWPMMPWTKLAPPAAGTQFYQLQAKS